MIREIARGTKFWDTGFVLQITMKSKYIKSMREKFRKDLTKAIADELRESYPPYVNPRFKILQQFLLENGLSAPFLEDDLEEILEKRLEKNMPSELELWYYKYLSVHHSQKSSDSTKVKSQGYVQGESQ